MNRTIALRAKAVAIGLEKVTQLFLSWSTHTPVTTATIAHRLTSTLALAGIDTNQYSVHSYRSAGLSSARSKDATVSQIMTAGNWTNANTFNSFYNAPACNTPVGKIILDHYQHSVSCINCFLFASVCRCLLGCQNLYNILHVILCTLIFRLANLAIDGNTHQYGIYNSTSLPAYLK